MTNESLNLQEIFFFESSDVIQHISKLTEKFPSWYIDGTMFDGGNMVLSCRGVADNEFNVILSKPESDMLEYCVLIERFSNHDGKEINELNGLHIWLDDEIVEKIKENPQYNKIEFIFFNLEVENPSFMAQLIP